MNVGTAANAAENLTVTGAGKLDELRVYSRYLTAAERPQLFRFPGGVESGAISGDWITDGSLPPGKVAGLGDLAYSDAVEVAQLGATLISGGFVKTDLIDVDHLLGESATFRGTLEDVQGVFSGSIESGPLELSISPPVTSSITTNGKAVRILVDELLADGVSPGTYQCSGTVDGSAVDQIQFSRGASTPLATANIWYVWWSTTVFGITTYWSNQFTEYVNEREYTLRLFGGGVELFAHSGNLVVSNGYWVKTASNQLGQQSPGEEGTSTSDPTEPTMYTIGSFTDGAVPGDGSISFTNGAFTMRMIQLPAYSASLPQWSVYLEDDGSGDYSMKVKGT